MRREIAAALLLPALLLAAGCTGPDRKPAGAPATARAFADCAGLTAPPGPPAGAPSGSPSAGGSASPTGAGSASASASVPGGSGGTETTARPSTASTPGGSGAGEALPEIALPCLVGGDRFTLAALRGPAVVNLWAAWCGPCQKELPAFQRLAQRTGDRLHVLGVDTADQREAAESLGADLGLTYPTLVDQDGAALRALRAQRGARNEPGPAGLPVTLFVDGAGRVRHLDNSGALDDAALADLVTRHLGVAVPR
ncbi:TlpA disulfide reductase family protein [Micromonospora sp. NPDC049559]|uniref:TlpA family protein disulfide reductase n=1 Tax=Micromonospora sp. NPDC049559 TaxID=3155923 RepID=UPI00342CCD86